MITITEHAKERAVERITKRDLSLFVKGMKEAIRLKVIRGEFWAVKVRHGRKVLGYAIGERGMWVTTLSPRMTVWGRNQIFEVQV